MRWLINVLLFLIVTPTLSAEQKITTPDKVVPAINDVELWQQVGQQPYEMTWVQREEDPHTLVDFENLEGWKLELYNGAGGELRRSREQQMWGQYVGKVLYWGTRPDSRVVARPPKPIPIPGSFDSIDMWGYGNHWSFVEDKSTPLAVISILITDARGKEFTVKVNVIDWKQWWLMHRKIPREILDQMVLPASFSGIEITKGTNTDPRYFFIDDPAFYKEELKPLHFAPQPKRNLKPYRNEIVGTNTGPGTLPFPTREETILPSNVEKDFKVAVRKTGANRFELSYKGRDATVVYEYQPLKGNLGELTAKVNGAKAFRPLDGGGVRFADTPAGQAPEGELIAAGVEGDAVKASFRYGQRQVDYELRLWQKSIVLDVWCDGGQAKELSFGRVSGVQNPRLIALPYLVYSGKSSPRVLLAGDESKPAFTSVWFDWYRSNASEAYTPEKPAVTGDSAEINGGMRYQPKTDGLRNNLYERIFVTNSPVYEETLPTIANPPSLTQEQSKQVLWTVTGPDYFPADHERCLKIRSYGLDKIMQHSHEVTWRDEGDSNTMKLHASPLKGGDAMLKWYVKAQNDMGWLQGVYTNYCDFNTVNTNWTPDFVIRRSDGEWRRAWPRNYRLKPPKAVEYDEYYAQRIKEKFGTKMSYTDVHTAISPWENTDYDARVPGAGTLAATFYAYGQLLQNDQRVYGPTQSEGTYEWLYAGLVSGNYGWAYTDMNLLTQPLDVAFRLTKIHPLETDVGVGDAYYYHTPADEQCAKSPKSAECGDALSRAHIDLFLATTIGYGNVGMLVTDPGLATPFGIETMTRSYYMMQQLQQQYAFVAPRRIEYAGRDGRMLTASQAQATGAIADSRLHVVYENGTEVYVNRSATGVWNVKDLKGKEVELPVSGWLVFNPANGFYEISANAQGRRIDYVTSPEFEFLDGRGQWTETGALGATGSVALRHKAGNAIELIDLYGNDRIMFQVPADGVLKAYDPEDKDLGKVEVRSPRAGWYEFKPVKEGRRYVFTW